MSSNAFARSRPRVRHQRVPRAHTCEHPRFLQLCNELAKGSSSTFGYSEQNVVEQQSSDLSNDNPDLRQDENRTKRKRSSNEPPMSSKKALTSSSSESGVSKKLKLSSEGTRPLSPSFTKCPICLLDCMDRDPSFTNTCFHLFCYVCIENWTKNKATCPLCRTKFSKIIYNIKSATNYEEKVASPVRRDDDDGYVPDRLMLEHFTSLNQTSAPSNRATNSDDVQFLFENLHRNPEVLMPQYFVNHQMDPRQRESLHSFNTVTSSANFSSNVPHSSFSATSYPIASNGYIALFPNPTNTAITSAYSANTGLTNMTINSDPNGRQVSRSGRLIYSRPNYEHPAAEMSVRMSRATIAPPNIQTLPIERAHNHHYPEQHQNHHQHHHHHHHHQHENRSSLDMSSRQIQRAEQPSIHFQTAFAIQPRQYNPNAFARRTYNGSHDPQHILDFYRRLPDIQDHR